MRDESKEGGEKDMVSWHVWNWRIGERYDIEFLYLSDGLRHLEDSGGD